MTVLVVEEQPHAVGGVITLGLDLLVGDEGDVRIGVAEQRDELFRHGAGEPAAVAFLELHRIGKPAERVAQRADRELDQHVAVRGRVIVDKDALAVLPDLDAEAHVIALAAVDATGLASRSRTGYCRYRDRSGARARDARSSGSVTRQPSLKSKRRPFGPACVGSSAGGG